MLAWHACSGIAACDRDCACGRDTKRRGNSQLSGKVKGEEVLIFLRVGDELHTRHSTLSPDTASRCEIVPSDNNLTHIRHQLYVRSLVPRLPNLFNVAQEKRFFSVQHWKTERLETRLDCAYVYYYTSTFSTLT